MAFSFTIVLARISIGFMNRQTFVHFGLRLERILYLWCLLSLPYYGSYRSACLHLCPVYPSVRLPTGQTDQPDPSIRSSSRRHHHWFSTARFVVVVVCGLGVCLEVLLVVCVVDTSLQVSSWWSECHHRCTDSLQPFIPG
jgi:hypothetical protein